MGLTRKFVSLGTLGAVNFRSSKERAAHETAKTAKYQKKAARQLRKQTRLMKKAR